MSGALAAVTAADSDPSARLQRALDLAFRYLSRRERTVAELQEQGYLDDAGYAQRFAEDRRELDGWGAERIARRLAAVGVGSEEIAVACSARDREGELEAAVEILRRRFRGPPEDDRERERALGMLVRRGYDLELAYDAVRSLAA